MNPAGLGVYCRALKESVFGSPGEAAEKARRYGVKWVALLGCWQHDEGPHKGKSTGPQVGLRQYAEAFRLHDIQVWVWGYPVAGLEHEFVDRMAQAAAQAEASGWLLDPEVSYKGREPAARRLVELTLDALDESTGLGVTSYPVPTFHPTWPWEAFGGVGFGSPQTYHVSEELVARAHREWTARGWNYLCPSLPAFGPHARDQERLRAYLAAQGDVPGIIVWDWSQLQPAEWRVYAEWAAGRR
jgi:hypothetical protein